MPNIDVHCHTTPKAAWAELLSVANSDSRFAGRARAVTSRPEVCNDAQHIGALDERIALMDEGHVDTEIVSSTLLTAKFFDSAEFSTDVSRSINDELSEAGLRHTGRYRFFSNLPLPRVAPSIDELHRSSKLPGFSGVVVPTVFGLTFDDPQMDDFYSELAAMRGILFLHPGQMENGGRFSRLGMETGVGWPTTTSLSIMELIYGKVLDRFPDITVITPHLGGTLMYLLGRVDNGFHSQPASERLSKEPPSWYMKRMYHDTVNFLHPALDMARTIVGSDHITLGSDFPWLCRDHMGACVENVTTLDWPEEELALVRGGNVERLLKERALL
ncbi:MAG: aminocarboxymuconate-semialdehyde decarboxylase [Chloroflexi bacterium]|nr:aminocarboxymuconate-semialdehyde decarboxylase [Chloroflexota bacterium]